MDLSSLLGSDLKVSHNIYNYEQATRPVILMNETKTLLKEMTSQIDT